MGLFQSLSVHIFLRHLWQVFLTIINCLEGRIYAQNCIEISNYIFSFTTVSPNGHIWLYLFRSCCFILPWLVTQTYRTPFWFICQSVPVYGMFSWYHVSLWKIIKKSKSGVTVFMLSKETLDKSIPHQCTQQPYYPSQGKFHSLLKNLIGLYFTLISGLNCLHLDLRLNNTMITAHMADSSWAQMHQIHEGF